MTVRFSDFRFFPVIRPTFKGDLILEGTQARVYRRNLKWTGHSFGREYLIETPQGQEVVTA